MVAFPGQSWRHDSPSLLLGDGWTWWNRPDKQTSKRTRVRSDGGGGPIDDVAKRAERAVSLVQMGEARARQALEGAQVAPGTLATLRALTDPRKRPPVTREVLSRAIQELQPREQFVLDAEKFLAGLRTAKRGAAGGPSSMTSDHLFPVLESDADSVALAEVAQTLAVGDVLQECSDLGG